MFMNTKTQLLDSAERVARMRGYDGFSYADLASDVGIRKASVHHHFPTKADLALALIRRYRQRIADNLERMASQHSTASKRLMAFIEMYRAAMGDGEALCLCVSLSIGQRSLTGPVLEEMELFHRDGLTWLTEQFALGLEDGTVSDVIDPADEAAACQATMEGAQLLARAAGSLAPFDRSVRALESRLFGMASP